MNPKITGCIVTYNNMKSIKDTVETVLKFTDPESFRLYVVDNGSTDGTPEFIRENYPEVCLIETNTNSGFGKGHNTVLPMLSSQYHIVINPDIVIKDEAINKIVDFMDNNPDIGLVSPKICFPDGREQILGKRNPRLKYLVASRMRDEGDPSKLLKEYAMLDCDLSDVTDIENTTGCFMVFRTDVFKSLKGFDPGYFMYFEDADIARRANKITRVVYYPHAIIYHVWGRESKRNFKLMLIHIKSMFRYFFKWKTI
ncbi:MAG: glycosyltransferase family 2 protein [Clostridia bacterium]|nr:glycosyltransferase family 2 protein [Clostridia bacterium]